MLRMIYVSLLCCVLLVLAGCEKPRQATEQSANSQAGATQGGSPAANAPGAQPSPGAANAEAKPKLDACTLLTSAEIQAVQGDPVKETKTDGRVSGGMSVSQCFYSVASFNKSVSLSVTQSDPAGGNPNGLREFWQRTFHKEGDSERERESERAERREKEREREREMERKGEKESEEQRKREREEEEEEGAPPKKITGVGEEAYWTGSRVGGALYVLQKNSFLRISVGGPGNEEDKINKSKALAQKALQRL
jgi:hypothetical protein